tara:strand:+ start:782 stop:1684 length:903 start_codon:yes stop_codon:yes gene_type:complete
MADRTWTGTTDGDWEDDANWGGESFPTGGEDVFFTSGSVSVDTTLDQSNIELASLTIGPKYTGTIGIAATETPLKLGSIAGRITYGQKVGVCYISGDTSGADAIFADVIVEATSTESPALNFVTCDITNLTMLGGKGTVYIGTGVDITSTILMIGCRSVTLEIDSAATIECNITISDGRLVTPIATNNLTMFGGLVEMADGGDGTTDTITIYDGIFKCKAPADTTITDLVVYQGFFDARAATAPGMLQVAGTGITITNTTVYEGGILDERNGLQNVTYSTPIKVRGGIVYLNAGRSMLIA